MEDAHFGHRGNLCTFEVMCQLFRVDDAGALRGVLAWPMERLHGATVGDLMARIVADVEVLGIGVGEFTVEI